MNAAVLLDSRGWKELLPFQLRTVNPLGSGRCGTKAMTFGVSIRLARSSTRPGASECGLRDSRGWEELLSFQLRTANPLGSLPRRSGRAGDFRDLDPLGASITSARGE